MPFFGFGKKPTPLTNAEKKKQNEILKHTVERLEESKALDEEHQKLVDRMLKIHGTKKKVGREIHKVGK
ncbi:unnamed protein product [Trifolium pratense]|uniref:Uncharacterized protein n=1 Tax=Trifolium pratense TaxID=57577 RepID=A0ACB0JWH1_TRIPR|nr:unnamed protein product [Trifolium pratense]